MKKVTMRELRKLKREELVEGLEVVDRQGNVKMTLASGRGVSGHGAHDSTYPNGAPIAGSEPPVKFVANKDWSGVHKATWEEQPSFWRQLNPKP